MTDYFELNEIDDSDVQMRFFTQTLIGEVKKWFKGLTAGSIADLEIFHRVFLNKWENKKIPL